MSSSIDAKEVFDKLQHPFLILENFKICRFFNYVDFSSKKSICL